MSKRSLLIVNNPSTLSILNQFINGSTEVLIAESESQILQKIDTFNPHLIILEDKLKNVNHKSICSAIRKRFSEIKVIFFNIQRILRDSSDYIYCKDEQFEEEEQKRVESIIQNERLAQVGIHTAEIVHNLKSPLTSFKLCLYKLHKEFGSHKIINRLDKATQKFEEIIQNILDLTHTNLEELFTETDINELILSEVEFFKLDTNVKQNYSIELNLGDIPKWHGNALNFKQVFGNIIKNASESLHKNVDKTIIITTRSENNNLVIEIKDKGSGINEENMRKLFETGFTTKSGKEEDGGVRGNGLGLPYCKRIIELHGGTINVTSKENVGTKVTLTFPLEY